LAQSGAPIAPPTDQAAPDPAVADYILGSGDNLRISVFGEDSLTGQFTVASNGHISFPLIGDVQASGKTVREVREEIAAALADGYIKDPRVSAEVMTFRPYYVLGEVEKPGEYPYIGGITVMNAIATAGGFTYRANNHDVFIKKPNETAEHKVRLNGTLELSPGDTLRVGERYF
jgi:polysaccharide export outer membrane protein